MEPRAEEAGRAVAAKDPGKGHFYVSIAKSAIRIGGCVVATFSAPAAGVLWLALAFLVAELLGIVEEIVD